ncbi:MAG: C40 family peptidase [Mobilicoccus sp.]|nr:C40 family peptidase [Mobilicoccus sp.]
MALAVATPTVALAEPTPTPTPSPSSSPARVTTTEAVIDAARAAAEAGESDVERLQESLEESRAEVEAAHVEAQLAAEKANAARELLTRRTAEAAEAADAVREADAQSQRSQRDLESMATRLYMQGGTLGELAWLLTGGPTSDLARRDADVRAAQTHRADTLAEAKDAHASAQDAHARAEAAEAAQQEAAAGAQEALTQAQEAVATAERLTDELEAEETRLIERLAELRRTSVEVEERRQAELERAAEEAQAEEVRARIEALADEVDDTGDAQTPPVDLPEPDRAAAAAAIAFARAQLGKPYLWGGNGPAAFDCSGLTVGAWRTGGRSIPRTAQWQYEGSQRVAIADLQPGDLVFFGASERSIHHVGLYVGNGQMIEAPRTGLNVRYSSIYRSSLLPSGGRV